MRYVRATATRAGWLAFLLGCGGMLLFPPAIRADEPPVPPKPKADMKTPSVDEVAIWIMAEGPFATEELEKVAAMGERLFPAFEKILDDPEYARGHAWRVFHVLRMMKCDRSRFLDRAVARLSDKDFSIRDTAIKFLQSAGGESEAAPLALMPLKLLFSMRLLSMATVSVPLDAGDKATPVPLLRTVVCTMVRCPLACALTSAPGWRWIASNPMLRAGLCRHCG